MLRLSHLLCRLRKRGHVRATEQPRPNNDHVYTLERDKYRFVDLMPRVPGPELFGQCPDTGHASRVYS